MVARVRHGTSNSDGILNTGEPGLLGWQWRGRDSEERLTDARDHPVAVSPGVSHLVVVEHLPPPGLRLYNRLMCEAWRSDISAVADGIFLLLFLSVDLPKAPVPEWKYHVAPRTLYGRLRLGLQLLDT